MSSRYIPGIVLSGASDLILELNGDPIDLAEQAGLPISSLSDADIPIDISSVLRLFNLSAQQLDCRNFAMILAGRNGMDIFGPLWVLLRSARSVRQMLEDLASNYDMYTRAATITLERSDEGLSMSWDTVSNLGVNPAQGAEYGFAMCVNEFRKLDPSFVPVAVQFRHAAPNDMAMHQQLFGNNLSFDQDRNAIYFSNEMLDTPMSMANSHTHSLVRSVLRWNTETVKAGLNDRIENIVRALLPYSPCTVEEVSNAIGMSKRTLQDRLNKQRTSFKEIKDKVRYDLALKYLNSSSLSLAEISEILGYSELSAFSRSFKRWHGEPASAIRREAIFANQQSAA